MEGPRAAYLAELKKVEDMTNRVFRSHSKSNPNMFQEFPLLFGKDNIENIRIIAEDEKPVANINYLPQVLSIYGHSVNVATLGGVGTLEEYRGRGHGTLLLNDCIRRMTNEQDIDLLFVSGNRNMYRTAGCMPAGQMYTFKVEFEDFPEVSSSNIKYLKYDEKDLTEWKRLYDSESVRYVRNNENFNTLIKSMKFIERNTITRHDLLLNDGLFNIAYVVFKIENNEGKIVEYAGSKQTIIDELPNIMKAYSLLSMQGYIMPYDTDLYNHCIVKGIKMQGRRLGGTVRIIDFNSLMKRLKPYFSELYPENFINELKFESEGENIKFIYKNDYCIVQGYETQNNLVFGGEELDRSSLFIKGDESHFIDLFKHIFPIPYPYTGNLSYV